MSGKSRGRGGRVKRQEVENEDGWTVVTHGIHKMGLGSTPGDGTPGSKKSKNDLQVAGQMPSQIVQGLTTEKLQTEFEKLQEKWGDSDVARQVAELVREKEMMERVKEAVCIGIGSFSRDWGHRWRSMWQLVLFVDVARHLDMNVMYAQDPAFTELDIEFLKLLNVTAMDSGMETHVTHSSFVFSPFVDWFILLPVFLKKKDPVLYVGNEILDDYTTYAQTEEKRGKLEECNALGKTFLENMEMRKLKDFEGHPHAFNGMVVYTKSPTTTTTSTTTTTTTDPSAPT
ncbi:hypothetical protein DE146DRAFT_137202 [Phaeosphaeria sp. MPI-PUGE-AT-0046c]|nr:hypothetical protein DE146DRAFT_137202 [Phaeosphaeria sp. MPI-PUGE-AT-0046c]